MNKLPHFDIITNYISPMSNVFTVTKGKKVFYRNYSKNIVIPFNLNLVETKFRSSDLLNSLLGHVNKYPKITIPNIKFHKGNYIVSRIPNRQSIEILVVDRNNQLISGQERFFDIGAGKWFEYKRNTIVIINNNPKELETIYKLILKMCSYDSMYLCKKGLTPWKKWKDFLDTTTLPIYLVK